MVGKIVRYACLASLLVLALGGMAWLAKHTVGPGLTVTWTAERPTAGPANSGLQATLSSLGESKGALDATSREYSAARSDHEAVTLAVENCYWSNASGLPTAVALQTHRVTDGDSGGPSMALNPFHFAALSFSDRLARERLAFSQELVNSRTYSRAYQLAIIIVGALATVVMAIRSMKKWGDNAACWISFSAIALSAIGTVLSSWSSFDGGTTIALRDQRALSQLQQLHWRIASDVLAEVEVCRNPGMWLTSTADAKSSMQRVDAWKARMEEILNSAVEDFSRPGDLAKQSGGGEVRTPTEPQTQSPEQPRKPETTALK
jgi:hypothetical protein